MSSSSTEREMIATREEMAANRVPLHCRDYCAHILIPLNKCRQEHAYMPWACKDELHEYEICLYQEYERRRAMKKELDAKK